MRVRRFNKIAARLSHVSISRLFKLLNQGVAAVSEDVFNFNKYRHKEGTCEL